MITDTQKEAALDRYYKRGILKEEVRSYEVSLWTLQDEFITVLKWSDVEQKGRIENPKMTLNVDGTENLTFSIPMYLQKWNSTEEQLDLVENPIWYNTQNGNLIEGLRKIKVIFNKGYAGIEKTFEFVIIKITEKHENDVLTCEVTCEGLAFHELGKIGYKISLSQDNFELTYKDWIEGDRSTPEPIENVQYWCSECKLTPWPGATLADANVWYYYIDMDWSSFAFSENIARDRNKVYEEPYTSSWVYNNSKNKIIPVKVQNYREKARPVEAEKSNLYNITQTIAEQFGIHCRYEYLHDENYHISAKVIVFYNNFNKENDGVLGFTYPYSSKTITRNKDVTDLTTKLYISPVDSQNELQDEISIMSSECNKMQEDYILNFDYLHKTRGITDEQYAAIGQYEIDIRKINDELIPVQQELVAFADKKVEIEANIKVADNSIKIDKEQIDYNSGLYNSLDAVDGTRDGYVTISANRPDTAFIVQDKKGKYYVNLAYTKKGIDAASVHVYKNWIPGNASASPPVPAQCTGEITGFKFEYDEFGNVTSLYNIFPYEDDQGRTINNVYLTYRYQPQLYYDNIIKIWEDKLASDEKTYDNNTADLEKLEAAVAADEIKKAELLEEKQKIITEFERMMGPALREGYWTPEDYHDYGDVCQKTLTLPETAKRVTPFTNLNGDDVIFAWDNVPFDDEDKIYYEEGVNQTKVYYPCINLTPMLSNQHFCEHINDYSFIFNTNYYDVNADLNDLKYTRNFTVGSEALLRFIRRNNVSSETDVIPVLVLVGAKGMTDDELTFMTTQSQGHPRLGIISVSTDNNEVRMSITNTIYVHDSQYWTYDDTIIQNCQQVWPRIKFNDINVKADTNNLQILYEDRLLTPFTNYSTTTRITEYGTNDNPIHKLEYYITIKPDVLWRCENIFGDAEIHYVVANIATSIYIDALEIAKKNSEPKVEYNLEANIIDENLMRTLYDDLARIILINDDELKLEEAFGYISQVDLDLDAPVNDTIEVKNYTSKFEDLFSSIVASTEAIQQNKNGIASAISGNVGLQASGFYATLLENDGAMKDYLDEYFTTSPTVEEMLANIFTEAGQILANTNKSLAQIASLGAENSSILSSFAVRVVNELSPRVTRGRTKPVDFKPGDIFIELDANNNEIGRYVATSDSLHATDDYGFTRTYNGTLGQIEGAGLEIDAVSGIVKILAQNEIFMGSGGNIRMHADEIVEIVGNRSVNIGGTAINIGSSSIDGQTVGGVNIVATSYTNADFTNAQVSKVLISPQEITMAGSKITMYTGTGSSSTSALILDGTTGDNAPAYGIWLGSSKGIRLCSAPPTVIDNGDGTFTTTYGANVDITPSHIFMGVDNGSGTASTEITEDGINISVGSAISTLIARGITSNENTSGTGVEINKEKIGMAIVNGNSRSVIIMDSSGILVGTGSNPGSGNGQTTSYVIISGSGVDIGSSGHLKVNTTNVVINSNASSSEDMFRLGSSASPVLRYKNGNLEINATGNLTLNSGNTITTSNSNISMSNTGISLTGGSISITSSGNLTVTTSNVIIKTNAGNSETIFQLKNSSTDYFKIYKDGSGNVIATLGGWTIESNKLYSGSGSTYVGLSSNGSGTYAIWCGNATDSSAPFAVTRKGEVYLSSLMVLDDPPHKFDQTHVTRGGHDYAIIDFSDLNFNEAISLSLGWSSSGRNLTASATAHLWGKFEKTESQSKTVSINAAVMESYAGIGMGSGYVLVGIGDTAIRVESVLISADPAYDAGWDDAAGASTSPGYNTLNAGQSIQITVPTTGGSTGIVTVHANGGGGSTCFIGGTQVKLNNNKTSSIEQLQVGQYIDAYDIEQQKFVKTEVQSIQMFKNATNITELQLSSGKQLILTRSHPLLTTEGWKALDPEAAKKEHFDIEITLLEVGDQLIGENNQLIDIINIVNRPDLDGSNVYNIDVEPYDNYIVEGIIAHNADDKGN